MSSGFLSEKEIEERRKTRQQEWDKIRRPDQPTVVPDEPYDHRSLFERLEEQRKKKEFEYEETHRLKNMIKGLDDDEVDFLEMVDRSKMEEERRKMSEEAKELQQFRSKVSKLEQKCVNKRIVEEVAPVSIKKASSSGMNNKLLSGIIVKKKVPENEVLSAVATSSKEIPSSTDQEPNREQQRTKLHGLSNEAEVEPTGIPSSGSAQEELISQSSDRSQVQGLNNGVGEPDTTHGEVPRYNSNKRKWDSVGCSDEGNEAVATAAELKEKKKTVSHFDLQPNRGSNNSSSSSDTSLSDSSLSSDESSSDILSDNGKTDLLGRQIVYVTKDNVKKNN